MPEMLSNPNLQQNQNLSAKRYSIFAVSYAIKDKSVLYINKEKSTAWFTGTGSARAVDQQSKDALFKSIKVVDETKIKTEKDLRYTILRFRRIIQQNLKQVL